MTTEEYLSLYEKFIKGQCTQEEKLLLMSYKDNFDFSEHTENEVTEDAEIIKIQVFEQIKITLQQRQRIFWLNSWWAAAAVILIAIAVMFSSKDQGNSTKANVTYQKPLLPKVGANNMALLTLGNGQVIKLDQANTGRLATNGSANIKKTQKGQVVYEANSSENGPVAINTIKVPRGNQFELTLSDGTKVWLNSETTLTFPTRFVGIYRKVTLQGEAYFEVAKNKEKPFIVSANQTSVQVLGTHFNVSAYPDDDKVKTTLLEGSVKLSNGNTSALIVPGQQATLAANSKKIEISTARINEVMAWTNGYFIFHDENIVNVMKQAIRWYDIDVEYQGNVKGIEFGGSISKYKDITALLHIMEMTHTIHYKIDGRRVVIME